MTDQNPEQASRRRRVARRKPRQRATDSRQVQQQLDRYERLLQTWVQKLGVVARRIEQYRKKAAYYQKRLAEMNAAELAAAEAAARAAEEGTRNLRAIE